MIADVLLDETYLSEGLRAAQEQHATAETRARSRLDAIDREIGKLRQRLQRATVERLDAEPGSETERALKRTADETEAAIRYLQADRAELEN